MPRTEKGATHIMNCCSASSPLQMRSTLWSFRMAEEIRAPCFSSIIWYTLSKSYRITRAGRITHFIQTDSWKELSPNTTSVEKPGEIPLILAILFGALLGIVCVGAGVWHCIRRRREKGTENANTLATDSGTVSGSVSSVYTDDSFWKWKKGFSRDIY